MPQVQTDLIDTGKLRMVFSDYPLDQVRADRGDGRAVAAARALLAVL